MNVMNSARVYKRFNFKSIYFILFEIFEPLDGHLYLNIYDNYYYYYLII